VNATAIPPTIVRVLERISREKWNSFVVVIDDEAATARLMGRGELAAVLTAGDVRDLASECLVRRVPPGALLVLHIGKEETRFHVVGGEPRRPGVPRGRTTIPVSRP